MLRKSQLGKNVMFLFKCNEETSENRRIAKELVHRWSRPIFYDQEAEEVRVFRKGAAEDVYLLP
jgi:transcription factor SPN1